jgi:hypothetical protein
LIKRGGTAVAERKKGIKYWSSAKGCEQIREWAADGLSAKEIAANMGISRSTLYEWVEKNSDISDSFTCGRTRANEVVENSLFKRCCGYNATVKKTIKLKKAEYNDDGKIVAAWEEPFEVEEEVHVPIDTAALKFFLTNRMPEKWRNTPIEITGEDSGGVIILSPTQEKPKLPPPDAVVIE